MKDTKKSTVPYGPKQEPWDQQTPDWSGVTGPLENPIPIYDAVPPRDVHGDFPKIDYSKFEIPPEGLSATEYNAAMSEFESFIKTQHKRFTGYQTNEYIEGNDELSWLLNIHTNNVGDPFTTGIFSLNTKFVERAVLDYFAALWRADWPYNETSGDIDRYWGYVMSMGSTEGNIYALYNGREYLSGGKLIIDPESEQKTREKLKRGKFALEKTYKLIRPVDYYENPNKYKPIAFYSEDTHYSVIKGVSVCGVVNFSEAGNTHYPKECPITKDGVWPDEVPSHNFNHDDPKSGTIDVDALKALVNFFAKKGHPVLIVLNEGSTWKGAYDNVPEVDAMLKELGQTYPWLWEREVNYKIGNDTHTDIRRGFWLHIDGALGSTYLPFLRMAKAQGKLPDDKPVPEFDFSIDSVMSIVSSLHKWIGAPWPGGIYMTKRKFQLSPPDTAGYIGSPDTTLGGSRNGFSPMLYWKYFAKKSYSENITRALKTEAVAVEFETKIKLLEKELQVQFPEDNVDLWIHRSALSLAVLFRKVNNDITYKYTVDSERICVPYEDDGVLYAEERTYSHVYSMTSLGEYGLVDKLINDIREACKDGWKNAFPGHWIEDGKEVHNPGKRHEIHGALQAL
ncbi:hypothetical protein VOI54_06590 [Tamlana sp. 2201CG12-4]|uniref:hypothetical protein n=1 Tax=Tamlana sp. 2201CG12-4 TaxID=3112582 RepID=UPI002DBF17EB|nr:hypothetical protein [Tamlana sp. 2201CG12-4]MEC3906679.1 hypothetical protein [Tamlana sp. 2201CG12-4]